MLVLEASGAADLQQTVESMRMDCEASPSSCEDTETGVSTENNEQNDDDAQCGFDRMQQSDIETKPSSTNSNNTVTRPRINAPKTNIELPEREVPSSSNSSSGSKTTRKRPHYLSHEDRCRIIERIAGGEQQSTLAAEFGVTRAAVCHIQKHRFEILARPAPQPAGNKASSTEQLLSDERHVYEMRTPSVLLLLTTLRDRRSDAATFRRAAGRIIMILIEEVLGQLGVCAIEVTTPSGRVTTGVEQQYELCGVKLGDEGYPFSVLFHQVEVDAAEGYIHVSSEVDNSGRYHWHLDRMDLPARIASYKVLLFTATCSNGGRECKAIEALIGVGALENNITLITIICAAEGIVALCSRFPQVRIVTAAIDGAIDPLNDDIVPGIGDFIARYNDE
ncbi:hypothetical protein PHMEG_0004687 [Phytophthora megakarya]|uniref:Phosphoribosyltransferase domain-containing protein n=1 Tax=Phytophthora megakarya TaxID=4795 RepID=A0A225WT81_9STRA|nr:hypothetical protein PHMEG_0004687 [Phytophthora megakarya]